eukprot:7156511-Prymnesium_polylepis.1
MPVRRAQLQHISMHAPEPNLGIIARTRPEHHRPNQTLGVIARTKRSGAPLPGPYQTKVTPRGADARI